MNATNPGLKRRLTSENMSEVSDSSGPWDNGKDAERLVRELLLYDGWGTVDVNKTQDSAPLIKWKANAGRLPDIIGFHRTHGPAFFEVKEKKSGPEYIVNHTQYEHCVDKEAYSDYTSIDRQTNIPVYICIYEKPTQWQQLLYKRLTETQTVDAIKNRTSVNYGKEQVFFPRSQFEMLSVTMGSPIMVNGKQIQRHSNPVLQINAENSTNNYCLDDYL